MFDNALTRLYSPVSRGSNRDPFFNFVERIFNEPSFRWLGRGGGDDNGNRGWLPAVDIRETEEAYLAHVELPGLDKEDVEVSVDDNVLTVSGERKLETKGENANYHHIERAYGRFSRSFSLPSGVDITQVSANFQDGVLNLTLPKSESSRSRKINVD